MIYTDSRYATGRIVQPYDARRETYRLSVLREFPTSSASFFHYVWVEGDRMDTVAYRLLGTPDYWWKIMDFNPEIISVFDVPVGTTIRIPSV